MNIVERIKKDKKTLNEISGSKAKLVFVWDYYKIPIISVALVLFIGIPMLIKALITKPVMMYAVLVNSDAQIVEVDENVFVEQLELANIDVTNKKVDINDYLTLSMANKEEDDIETLQVLDALFYIGDLDVFVGFKEDFDKFVEADAFLDLKTVIDKGLLDVNNDDLYKYNDSNGEQIVGGIVLHKDSPLHKAYYYHDDVIIGIASNAVNIDNAVALISQLLMN